MNAQNIPQTIAFSKQLLAEYDESDKENINFEDLPVFEQSDYDISKCKTHISVTLVSGYCAIERISQETQA